MCFLNTGESRFFKNYGGVRNDHGSTEEAIVLKHNWHNLNVSFSLVQIGFDTLSLDESW
jgi:hypothetical protein